jgi:hypothetical protein
MDDGVGDELAHDKHACVADVVPAVELEAELGKEPPRSASRCGCRLERQLIVGGNERTGRANGQRRSDRYRGPLTRLR